MSAGRGSACCSSSGVAPLAGVCYLIRLNRPIYRPVEAVERSPLAHWLQRRIDEAGTIDAEGTRLAYVKAMHAWHVQNVNDLLKEWPEHVRAYNAQPQDVPSRPRESDAASQRGSETARSAGGVCVSYLT